MTPENFCYWLQGFFEISGTTELTQEQVAMIEEHLQLVFTKKTGVKKTTDIWREQGAMPVMPTPIVKPEDMKACEPPEPMRFCGLQHPTYCSHTDPTKDAHKNIDITC